MCFRRYTNYRRRQHYIGGNRINHHYWQRIVSSKSQHQPCGRSLSLKSKVFDILWKLQTCPYNEFYSYKLSWYTFWSHYYETSREVMCAVERCKIRFYRRSLFAWSPISGQNKTSEITYWCYAWLSMQIMYATKTIGSVPQREFQKPHCHLYELLHSDICEMPVNSGDGFKYFAYFSMALQSRIILFFFERNLTYIMFSLPLFRMELLITRPSEPTKGQNIWAKLSNHCANQMVFARNFRLPPLLKKWAWISVLTEHYWRKSDLWFWNQICSFRFGRWR